MIPVSILTHWIGSVTYRGGALAVGSGVGPLVRLQAARIEVNQQLESEKQREQDVPGELVERIVEDSEIQRQPGA